MGSGLLQLSLAALKNPPQGSLQLQTPRSWRQPGRKSSASGQQPLLREWGADDASKGAFVTPATPGEA